MFKARLFYDREGAKPPADNPIGKVLIDEKQKTEPPSPLCRRGLSPRRFSGPLSRADVSPTAPSLTPRFLSPRSPSCSLTLTLPLTMLLTFQTQRMQPQMILARGTGGLEQSVHMEAYKYVYYQRTLFWEMKMLENNFHQNCALQACRDRRNTGA